MWKARGRELKLDWLLRAWNVIETGDYAYDDLCNLDADKLELIPEACSEPASKMSSIW